MNGIRGDDVIWATLTLLPHISDLADLAERREGFTTDSGIGVSYHHEQVRLCAMDGMAEGDPIPSRHVLVFMGWGPPDGIEAVVTEDEYLPTLASVLAWAGFDAHASKVSSLVGRRDAPPGEYST